MAKTTYEEMTTLIKNHIDFTGNSVTAYTTHAGTYVVKSYNTEMLFIYPDGRMLFNDKVYSNTTRKIQCLIARLLPFFERAVHIGPKGGKHVTHELYFYNHGWEVVTGEGNFEHRINEW